MLQDMPGLNTDREWGESIAIGTALKQIRTKDNMEQSKRQQEQLKPRFNCKAEDEMHSVFPETNEIYLYFNQKYHRYPHFLLK